MCEQCCAATTSFGYILPGWTLVRATKDGHVMKNGDWGLVQANDPDFIFTINPMQDLLKDFTDEEISSLKKDDPLFIKDDEFFAEAVLLEAQLLTDPWLGYTLVKAAIEAGYNQKNDGNFAAWLLDRIACHVNVKITN